VNSTLSIALRLNYPGVPYKKTFSSRIGRRSAGSSPKANRAFVAAMEVTAHEDCCRLHGGHAILITRWFFWTRPQATPRRTTRLPIPMKPVRPPVCDYEYSERHL